MTAAVSEQTAWFGLVKQNWNLVGNNLIYILNKTLKKFFYKIRCSHLISHGKIIILRNKENALNFSIKNIFTYIASGPSHPPKTLSPVSMDGSFPVRVMIPFKLSGTF